MTAKKLAMDTVFILFSLVVFFLFAKLLLLCAGLFFTVAQRVDITATTVFLIAGLLCSLFVIYKN